MADFENIAFICRTCDHDFDLLVSTQQQIDEAAALMPCSRAKCIGRQECDEACDVCDNRPAVAAKLRELGQEIAWLTEQNRNNVIAKDAEIADLRQQLAAAQTELEHWKSCNLYPSTYREVLERLKTAERERDEARALCAEVREWHTCKDSSDYNECDVEPCAWCEQWLAVQEGK